MDILKTFLEIEVDEEGDKIEKSKTSRYKLFADGEEEELEKPLDISQYLDINISKSKKIKDYQSRIFCYLY